MIHLPPVGSFVILVEHLLSTKVQENIWGTHKKLQR